MSQNQPTVDCPNCNSALALKREYFGKMIECPVCHNSVRMPKEYPKPELKTEKQILVEIRNAILESNEMISLFWWMAVINLVLLGVGLIVLISQAL